MSWLTRKSMKIVYWLDVDWSRRTKRSTIDCHSRRLTMRQVKMRFNHRLQREDFFLSQIHDHSRWLTMRIVKMKFNHRLQRENFRFVKIRSVASFTKIRSVASWLFSRELSFRWSEDALCKFFIQFTKIRSVASWSLSKRTSHFGDLILLTRVFRRAICFKAERLIECQLISQNSKREIAC